MECIVTGSDGATESKNKNKTNNNNKISAMKRDKKILPVVEMWLCMPCNWLVM